MKIARRRFLKMVAGIAALVPTRAAAEVRTIELICRSAWGAKRPTGTMPSHTIKRLTVHHSAVKLTDNRDAPERIRQHQLSHQARGWSDIAYHFIVDRRGNIYRGRNPLRVGDTATDYSPRGHLLVLAEGHFGLQRVSRSQMRALVELLAWASRHFEVPVRTIHGHRDYAQTACPGRWLYKPIADGTLRAKVRRRLAAGGVRRVFLCGRAGRRRVAAIERGDR